eukprot:9146394-Alexandrium_andersonii.AAC.1
MSRSGGSSARCASGNTSSARRKPKLFMSFCLPATNLELAPVLARAAPPACAPSNRTRSRHQDS